jgi:hypothetical protein
MSFNDELLIYKKTETLLDTVYPRLINFPAYEKFALSEHIRMNLFDLLKCLSLANNVKSKRLTYLQEADGHLQLIKTQIKFAKRRKYISKGFFEEVDERTTEISKMLKGYIKASVK